MTFVRWFVTYQRSYLCGRPAPSRSSYSSVSSQVDVLDASFCNNDNDDDDNDDDGDDDGDDDDDGDKY